MRSHYWVEPGRLLAGSYPADFDELRAAGVTLFLDLTEEGEYGLAPYAGALDGARAVRMPVRDFGCPSAAEMTKILDLIDAELARDEVVYVHCYGGIGRTGTVVGCYLVRHGRTGDEALTDLERLRGGGRRSPETDEQREMVLGWIDP